MADQYSVWVSGLSPPINVRDILNFFSRAGVVEDTTIPDVVHGTEVLVTFSSPDNVADALKYDRRSFRDSVISVSVPTAKQLATVLKEEADSMSEIKQKPSATELLSEKFKQSVHELSQSEISSMMAVLASVAKTKRVESTVGEFELKSAGTNREQQALLCPVLMRQLLLLRAQLTPFCLDQVYNRLAWCMTSPRIFSPVLTLLVLRMCCPLLLFLRRILRACKTVCHHSLFRRLCSSLAFLTFQATTRKVMSHT